MTRFRQTAFLQEALIYFKQPHESLSREERSLDATPTKDHSLRSASFPIPPTGERAFQARARSLENVLLVQPKLPLLLLLPAPKKRTILEFPIYLSFPFSWSIQFIAENKVGAFDSRVSWWRKCVRNAYPGGDLRTMLYSCLRRLLEADAFAELGSNLFAIV